jgi:hypothetical protein
MEKINSRVKTKGLLEDKKFSVSDMTNEVNYSKLSNLFNFGYSGGFIWNKTTWPREQFNIFSWTSRDIQCHATRITQEGPALRWRNLAPPPPPPTVLLTNIGKASICHSEKRKSKKPERQVARVLVGGEVEPIYTTVKKTSSSSLFLRYRQHIIV